MAAIVKRKAFRVLRVVEEEDEEKEPLASPAPTEQKEAVAKEKKRVQKPKPKPKKSTRGPPGGPAHATPRVVKEAPKQEPQIQHLKGLIRKEDGTSWFEDVLRELPFAEAKYATRGGVGTLKRKVCRIDSEAFPSYPILSEIALLVSTNFGRGIRGAFANHFEGVASCIPYHRDTYECDVLTVSFGGTRIFLTKDEEKKVTQYVCEDGDVVIFTKAFNSTHKHSVPVRRTLVDPRISIVFFLSDES